MRVVGLKTLRNRLGEYVRIAAAGETVLIADRDEVVAELTPPSATRGRAVPDVLLAEAVRNGLVSPAVAAPGLPPEPPGVAPLREILDEIDEDRAQR